jgi:hypothetical protein
MRFDFTHFCFQNSQNQKYNNNNNNNNAKTKQRHKLKEILKSQTANKMKINEKQTQT